MIFIVIEIQKMDETRAATIVNSYTTINDAEAKYHTILAAAAVSAVPVHSAVILREDGILLKQESYKHIIAEE